MSPGATVAPVILASDKTQLSLFGGSKAAWPIYITIGNIAKSVRRQPSKHATLLLGYLSADGLDHIENDNDRSIMLKRLFHDSMSLILEPLIVAGRDGVQMTCADGLIRRVFPILHSYVADHPEQCLVAGIKHNYCPLCEVDPREKGQLQEFTSRSYERTKDAVDKRFAGVRDPAFKKLGLRPVRPFWLDLPHVDLGTLFPPDILHQLHKGMFQTHLLAWCKKMMTEEELDRRFQALAPFSGLRHFGNGISHLHQMSGKEQKELEKVLMVVIAGSTCLPRQAVIAASGLLNFIYLARYPIHTEETLELMTNCLALFHKNKKVFLEHDVCSDFDGIPKLHSLLHYVSSIRSKGAADGYSTESPERLHIDFAKRGYRASNKHSYLEQMILWLQRQEVMNYMRSYLAWSEGYTSFIDDGADPGASPLDATWDLDALDDAALSQVEPITAGALHSSISEKEGNMGLHVISSASSSASSSLPSLTDTFDYLNRMITSSPRLSKRPTSSKQSLAQIRDRYSLPDFDWYFFDYLERNASSEIYHAYSDSNVGINTWTTLWLPNPRIRDMSVSSKWFRLSASPSSTRQNHLRTRSIPAQYSTVLILHDKEATGIYREWLLSQLYSSNTHTSNSL